MKGSLKKLTACCLMGSMIFTLVPMTAAASATAGVTDALSEYVTVSENTTSVYAGVSSALGTYLVSAAEINANSLEMVANSEEDDLISSQNASEAAKVDAEDVSNLCVAKVDNFVYVRSEPSKDGEVKGKLYNKNVATVLAVEDGWYKIESGNLKGYVCADYVVVGNGDALASAGTRYATVTTDTLRVREKATTESDILGLVPKGEDIVVMDEKDGWVKVSIEEGDGWVSTDYVTLRTEYTYGETNKEEKERLAKEEAERKAAEAAAQKATSSSSGSSSSSSSSGKSYSNPSGYSGSSVASYAVQFVGNPYVYGGSSLTNGTDCSGFVMSVYKAFGISLPHSSTALRSCGRAVSSSEMKAGDIVCYSGHVAIYIGNGQIVHASNRRDGIKISNVNYKRWITIRRIF